MYFVVSGTMPTSDHVNRSLAYIFIIVGFETMRDIEIFLFSLFSIMYILTLGAHVLIITLVLMDNRLHKPMYLLLANFSLVEVLYTTVTIPKMLDALLTRNKEIPSAGCLAQFYFFFAFGAAENCFLVVMGYDRYAAICQPLHYTRLMTRRTTLGLALAPWIVGFITAACPTIWISSLSFCFPNYIDHFFCDYSPLLKLSCEDTSRGEFTFSVISWSLTLGCFSLIMVSYTFIIFTVLKIPSVEGQKKAFNTCASHLTVVLIFNGTIIFMYIRPNSHIRFTLDKVVSIFYCVVTPLMNPMIYCLRNKEVKGALRKAFMSQMITAQVG
ncbi:olfactory receptor 6F1-like [Rana temporaria]|uniref:olfactory receptor 6F1-like n=1 Tax=Rana temporaria TaxID=8407 RepID=UPI001AAD28C3|nr:olfactory receptor 6F1-like [Rana temporaria]